MHSNYLKYYFLFEGWLDSVGSESCMKCHELEPKRPGIYVVRRENTVWIRQVVPVEDTGNITYSMGARFPSWCGDNSPGAVNRCPLHVMPPVCNWLVLRHVTLLSIQLAWIVLVFISERSSAYCAVQAWRNSTIIISKAKAHQKHLQPAGHTPRVCLPVWHTLRFHFIRVSSFSFSFSSSPPSILSPPFPLQPHSLPFGWFQVAGDATVWSGWFHLTEKARAGNRKRLVCLHLLLQRAFAKLSCSNQILTELLLLWWDAWAACILFANSASFDLRHMLHSTWKLLHDTVTV